MLLQFVPALADSTVTMTSTFNGAAGVPVDAKIPLTFSEDVTLSDSDITVSPDADITLSGSGTSYFVAFNSAMNYETEYTVTVGSYGSVKYTTQFDTTSAKNYNHGTYTNGGTNTFDRAMKEFTMEIDVDALYNDAANATFESGSANLYVADSAKGLGVYVDFSYKKDGTGTIGFRYAKPTNSSVAINHLVKPTYTTEDTESMSLTKARKYSLTLKDYTLYIFNTSNNESTMLGYIDLTQFYQANFKTLGFAADTWKVSGTTYVGFKFADSSAFTATSTLNNMKGVPVNAQIPLTYTKDVNLTKADVTVSPEADFTLEGSEKDYAVKFTDGMDYETEYSISIKDVEIVKYKTGFDCSASADIKGNTSNYSDGTTYRFTLDNTSKNFSVTVPDVSTWFANTAASNGTVTFEDTGKEGYKYSLTFEKSNGTAKVYPTIYHPNIPASSGTANNGGSISYGAYAADVTDYAGVVAAFEDYTLYLYGIKADNSVEYLYKWSFLEWRGNWQPESGDIIPTKAYWTGTGVLTAKFGTTVPLKVTSALNGKVAVPVTANIPLTCNKNVVLSSDSVSVSPETDFTVEGSGKNYAVKFTNGMKSNTEYTVSVDGVEVAKYSTAYGPLTAVSYQKEVNTELPTASTNFVAALDFSSVLSVASAASSNIKFKDTDKNIWFGFDFNYDTSTIGDKFKVSISGADNEEHTAGPGALFDVKRSEMNTLVITHTNYKLKIYALDKNGNVLAVHDTQSTEFAKFSLKTLGYEADSIYLWNTSGVKVSYAAIPAVEITSCTPSNGVVNATAAVNTTLDNDAVLIFAAYSDNGMTLVDADVKNASDVANGAVSFKVNGTPTTYKLFVFDSTDSLTPIVNAVSGSLK